MLSAMVKDAGSSLTGICLCAMTLLAFSSFLDVCQLTKIWCCDKVFSADTVACKYKSQKVKWTSIGTGHLYSPHKFTYLPSSNNGALLCNGLNRTHLNLHMFPKDCVHQIWGAP